MLLRCQLQQCAVATLQQAPRTPRAASSASAARNKLHQHRAQQASPTSHTTSSTSDPPHSELHQRRAASSTIAALLQQGHCCIVALRVATSPSLLQRPTVVRFPSVGLSSDFCSLDVRPWTSIRLLFVERSSTDFRPTFVHRTFVHELLFIRRSSTDFRPSVLRPAPCVLCPAPCCHTPCRLAPYCPAPCCLTSCLFIQHLFDFHAIFVCHGSFLTTHFILQIVHCVKIL